MILVCLNRKTLEIQEITAANQALLSEALWIDLLSPSKEEEALVEQQCKLEIPTREEMGEIELSSRLYKESGTLYMTATMIAQADSPAPMLDPVSFMLTQQQLITIRYIEPKSFKLVVANFNKLDNTPHDAITVFIELLDATVDRLADILELVGRRMDEYSKTIFQNQTVSAAKLDYKILMQQMGANADLNTKVCESLITFNRLITFFSQMAALRIDENHLLRLGTQSKDISSLSDHAIFLSAKVNFLLDATLGMVSIEQNNIIKIFSVAAVIFLPPTLVASIYGMNFKGMPDLDWHYGYAYALGLILFAAWLPYRFFKHKKWL
jgi:magnesium transporter